MVFSFKLFIGLFLLSIFVVSCGPGKYDSFAQCLTREGVTMFGAYWCPHCQNQKKMFGKSFEFINYTECASPSGGQTQYCDERDIKGYPTWQFSSGERFSGEISIQELTVRTGCKI